MKKARRFSFSMVELLLVIAVFSILSLLLCTAGEAAKKDAELAICAIDAQVISVFDEQRLDQAHTFTRIAVLHKCACSSRRLTAPDAVSTVLRQ